MIARALAAMCALALCGVQSCGGDAEVAEALARDAQSRARIAALELENSALRTELDAHRARTAEIERVHGEELRSLERELGRVTERRLERENEWRHYTRGISDLSLGTAAAIPAFAPARDGVGVEPAGAVTHEPEDPLAQAAAAESAASAARNRERSAEIVRTLRSLFAIEEILGMELFECGELQGDSIGPVVLRLCDAGGRPVGTLCADRLRLEASRAARTLTLVLEHGYERRGEMRVPFDGGPIERSGARSGARSDESSDESSDRGGVRRIELPDIDPAPWIEALPELTSAVAASTLVDDGRWDLRELRASLNVLLREDAEHGYFRMRGLGGVRDEVLFDVALDQLDTEGRIKCKLFADRMLVTVEGTHVQIVLESGAQVRGDAKTPFLEGRYRITLPRADAEAWIAAGVPGVSPVPQAKRP